MKKKMLAVLLLSVFLVSGLFGCGQTEEGVVAVVNGDAIYQEELDMNYRQIIDMYSAYGYDVADDAFRLEARNAVLDGLIEQKLLMQEAERRGIEVPDEEVEVSIKTMVDVSYDGVQEDFEADVEAAGMTMDYYREIQKSYLIQQKLQQELVNNPEVVDVIKARHILVDTEEEALDIIAQLDGGADFAALAQEHSTDPGSGANGGDLGYFAVNGVTTSKMVEEFTAGCQALEIGQYSPEPVQSQFGYHIILVEDKQSEVNLLEDADKYESVLQGIYNYGMQNLASSLRADAKIEEKIDRTVAPAAPEVTPAEGEAAEGDAAEGDAAEENAAEENAADEEQAAEGDAAEQK